ncbi:MAG: hypothetical protein ACYTGX_04070 [Planctomycetota bacterium]|jgi:hypothetical protein
MTKAVLGAMVLVALGGVALFALRPAGDVPFTVTGDPPVAPATSPRTEAQPTGGDAPVPGPAHAGTAANGPGTPAGPAATPPRAEGTPEALTTQLQAARTAKSAAKRDSALNQAWVEYLTWAGREGMESLRAAALDEMVALYHGEPDAEIRRKLLDRIDNTGTEPILQLMFEAARSGRTEPERLSAIQNLGKFGEAGAVTARVALHPAAPDAATAAADIAKVRQRARAELQSILETAPSDREREAIEFALKRLAMGEKR